MRFVVYTGRVFGLALLLNLSNIITNLDGGHVRRPLHALAPGCRTALLIQPRPEHDPTRSVLEA